MKNLIPFFSYLLLIGAFQNAQAQSIDTARVFPNPVSDTLNLYFALTKTDTVSVKVSDVVGQKKLQPIHDSVFVSGAHHLVFRVFSLSSGVYLVELSTKSGASKIVKFTKEDVVSTVEVYAKVEDMYPNPVMDLLHLPEGVLEVQIFDVFGKSVQTFTKPNTTLDLRMLPSGNYFVVMQGERGKTFVSILQKVMQ